MFFYLSKAAGLLLLPSGLILLALAFGVYFLAVDRLQAGRRCLVAGLVGLVLCGLSPLGDLLTRPLEERFDRADLAGREIQTIIVLGGAEQTSPRELMGLNEAAERMTEAVALAYRFPKAALLFSGGSAAIVGPHSTGAGDARRLFESLGVPSQRIVLEDRSRTTWENAAETCKLLSCLASPQRPGAHVLVTSAWHMPRAVGSFRAAGLDVLPWPVDYRGPTPWRLRLQSVPEGLQRMDTIVREYLGLVAYRLSGRSDALVPGP